MRAETLAWRSNVTDDRIVPDQPSHGEDLAVGVARVGLGDGSAMGANNTASHGPRGRRIEHPPDEGLERLGSDDAHRVEVEVHERHELDVRIGRRGSMKPAWSPATMRTERPARRLRRARRQRSRLAATGANVFDS